MSVCLIAYHGILQISANWRGRVLDQEAAGDAAPKRYVDAAVVRTVVKNPSWNYELLCASWGPIRIAREEELVLRSFAPEFSRGIVNFTWEKTSAEWTPCIEAALVVSDPAIRFRQYA